MRLYLELLNLIKNIAFLKKSNGEAIKIFCRNNGLAYIKLAQILATQNYGDIFTEEDRKDLEEICDDINPLPFSDIKKILETEYGNLDDMFTTIDENPIGAASISQVHKATLKDGRVVALKIKRKDITSTLEKDLKRLQIIATNYISFLNKHHWVGRIVDKFIPILNLSNQVGIDKAFILYYSWILDETDFKHEVQNIKDYTNFARQVNGQIPSTVDIVIPKVYEELCGDNIIVMEYIPYKNFNHINDEDAKVKALNSYIQLSFHAMFHGIEVCFHGDPHGGNIYLDDNGNIGFLDMGLLFKLSNEDIKLTKDFFFSAYLGDSQKLLKILTRYSSLSSEDENKLKVELVDFCSHINEKTITAYFTDMIAICLKFNISPPDFLFCMAKAFICLNGISSLSNNNVKGFELLQKQALEYLITENINNVKGLGVKLLKLSPTIIHSGLNFVLKKSITHDDYQEIVDTLKNEETRKTLNDALDFLQLISIIGKNSLGR